MYDDLKGCIMTYKVNREYVDDRDIGTYDDIQEWMMKHRNAWCLMWLIKLSGYMMCYVDNREIRMCNDLYEWQEVAECVWFTCMVKMYWRLYDNQG